MMDLDIAQEYVTSGLDATHMKLVRKPEDIDDGDYFRPDMCHQIFGDTESIFGYKNLHIYLYYSAATFKCFFTHSYGEKIKQTAVICASTYDDKINMWLPSMYYTKKEDFLQELKEEKNPNPFGEQVNCFKLEFDDCKDVEYAVYTCTSSEPGYKEFHQRMETLIIWFIDAANFIEVLDERWRFFVLYEKSIEGTEVNYYPIGYATIYKYYSYPDSFRFRISQFIVFPPYQNRGLGTNFLASIYQFLRGLEPIYDITVEDPSESFQLMRDYLDVKACLEIPAFSESRIKGDYSKEMIDQARSKLKITEKQVRRVYEIIRMFHTERDPDQESPEYVAKIKGRLSEPMKRERRRNKKRSIVRESIQSDLALKIIDRDYHDLIKLYRHVCNRVEKSMLKGILDSSD